MEQFFHHIVVRDHAVSHGADSLHITGGSSQHASGGAADADHLAVIFVHGNHGRFPQHDALPFRVDEHIGCAQIDAEISG